MGHHAGREPHRALPRHQGRRARYARGPLGAGHQHRLGRQPHQQLLTIAAYTAAKHGLLGLTRALAAEWVQAGITVNLVAPGYVDTPMTDATVANIAARTGRDADAARAIVMALSPQHRLVAPSEVVPVVCLLARDEAASITGAVLAIDGGASAIAATG